MLREERLGQAIIKVGKTSAAHLSIDDEAVSRTHAVIEVKGPDHITIQDLGSTTGTFVNGKQIQKATKLEPGDTILVGATRIELAPPQLT